MPAGLGAKMSAAAAALPCYYYTSDRPSSDSGLSSDEVSTVTSDEESSSSSPCYQNLQFPPRLAPPPPPPFQFRDEHHLDEIPRNKTKIELADCVSGLTITSDDSHDFVLEDISSNMTLPNTLKDNVEILHNKKVIKNTHCH